MTFQMLRRYSSLTAVTALLVVLGMVLAGGTAAQYPGYTYPPPQNQPSGSTPSNTTSSTTASGNSVTILGDYTTGYRFSPKKLTIKAGKKVSWSWSSDDKHNVTFSKHKHSKTKASISSFKVKFKKPGTYKYHCTVHGFKGKIVVN